MDTSVLRGIAIVVAAYFIGGIPWGVIIARLSGGPDPRTLGSGRTGGANVARALGLRYAVLAGLLDVAKGSVAVLVAIAVGAGIEFQVLAALAAIVGHSRSPFIGLQGGRGVSPGFGGLLVLQPLIALAVIPVFGVILFSTRISSLASLTTSAAAGVLVALATAVWRLPPVDYAYAVAGTALIWAFHHDNIRRLLTGQERRFGGPPAP